MFGLTKHSNDSGFGRQLMQHLDPLWPQSVVKKGYARDVTTRPIEAGDKSSPDRVGAVREDNRDFRRGRFGGEGRVRATAVKITDT